MSRVFSTLGFIVETGEKGMTRYPTASLRELLVLSIPLIFTLFSTSFMGFCDRFFLARYSLHSFEASVSAGTLCILFQNPLIRLVAMAQVFVGLYKGAQKNDQIGRCVWQMIWLSIFSMVITLPMSWISTPFFFSGTQVQEGATTYFQALMFVNFLFPLGTALSSYFIGQGRTKVIFYVTILAHLINIGLDYLFIFGYKNIIPEMGIFGAALATGIAQAINTLLLFCFFLSKKDRKEYRTDLYKFNWESFWTQTKVGIPRAIARIIILTGWASIVRIMTIKGADYLMVLSIGVTLIQIFSFIPEGMSQGIITIASNLMGGKKYAEIWKLARSALGFIGIIAVVLAFPFLFFPKFTLSFFIKENLNPESLKLLKNTCTILWFYFICFGFYIIGFSFITASRDLPFYLLSVIFVWITSFSPIYITMNLLSLPPDYFWGIMCLEYLCFGCAYLFRISKEKWKESPPEDIKLFSN